MNKHIKQGAALLALGLVLGGAQTANAQSSLQTEAQAARADIQKTFGFIPGFFRAMADAALPGTWEEMKGLQLNPNTALDGRSKELIGLAVSAQIPCKYCVYAHTEFAKLQGAGDADVAEAVAVGAIARHWSTIVSGAQISDEKVRADVARILSHVKKGGAPAAQIAVVDAASARKDIEQTLGFVPEMLNRISESALPGAWRELKMLKLNPATRLSPKLKALAALAVASQVPSRSCVVSETEFAKLAGASEREISEAIGMAAITRNMSTLLNGQQTDEAGFAADIKRLVAGAKAAQKHASATTKKSAAR